MTIKTELHVCSSHKDTAYLYHNKYNAIGHLKDLSLTITNSRSVLSTLNKVMIFCTVERLEYYYGHEFNTVVYHDNTITKVTDRMFAILLTRERR